MDENEEKLEEIKRAFISKIENIRTLPDITNLIKDISPTKVKNFIKNQLQQDISNQENAVIHIGVRVAFKQSIINEIDKI